MPTTTPPRFLYQFEDSNGLSYFYSNGVLSKNNLPTPLQHSPDGWSDIEFSFDTNDTYFSLFRSVSTPLKFVREGAQMLRDIMYKQKGYSEKLFVRIMQADKVITSPQLYSLCYYGQIDLTSFVDDPGVSVTATTVEGGLKSFLSANDSTTYDIVCSNNSPKWIKPFFDGVTLKDTYSYSVITLADVDADFHTIPIVYINNEGDSVGVLSGSQSYISIPSNYFGASTNDILQPLFATTTFSITGTIPITNVNVGNKDGVYRVRRIIADKNGIVTQPVIAAHSVPSGAFTLTINDTVTLQVNQKLFYTAEIDYSAPGVSGGTVSYGEGKIKATFLSTNLPSTAYALRAIWLGQALLDKMTGQPGVYTFASDFFTNNPGLLTTCGDALRNTVRIIDDVNAAIDDYYISTTFQDFFSAYSLQPMGLLIQGNVLRMEPLTDLDGAGNTNLDLGEVSKATISPIKDKLVGLLNVGYPDANTTQNAGKYEFNAPQYWKLPTDAVNTTLDRINKYHAGCFEIEFLRSQFTGKDSTDSSGDKQPYLVDTVPGSEIGQFEGTADPSLPGFTLIAGDISRFIAGDIFTLTGTANNDATYGIVSVNGNSIEVDITTNAGAVVGTVIYDSVILNRPAYSSITGVLDNTVFNVEISPKRILLKWAAYLASLFFQQPADQITQTSANKNNQLVTVLNGVTTSENAPVTIAALGAPLFLPYLISLSTEIPQTFQQVINQIMTGQKGDIHALINGKDVYMLPLFCKMSTKPGTSEAQDWQLVVSPRTSLLTLLSLSNTGFTLPINQYSMYISDLQPVHWVQYDYQKANGIQQLQSWQDWEENRFPSYPTAASYLQKWKTSDTIKIWFGTNGIASLVLYIYDRNAALVTTYPLNTLPSAAFMAPNLLKYLALPVNSLAEGCYTLVIQSGATPYLISRIEVTAYDPNIVDDTVLVKYSNSTNTIDYCQELGEIQLRLDGQQGIPAALAEITGYINDQRTYVDLQGKTFERRPYYFGYPKGHPEWMQKKINMITADMDSVSIEDYAVVRESDAQFDVTVLPGYNLVFSTIELLAGDNNSGRVIDDVTGAVTTSGGIVVVVDTEGIGDSTTYQQIIINP